MTLYPPERDGERGARAQLVGQALIIAAVLATLLLAISPTPYVVEKPGPVYDTLGTTEVDGEQVPVLAIEGAETFPTEGRLDLLTVYLDGSRERPLDWFDVIGAWFDPTRAILPVDAVFPEGQTQQEADEESAHDMQLSQQSAIAAALTQLDIGFDATVTIDAVSPDSPADGELEVGDEVVSVGGTAITSDAGLRSAVQDAGVGTPVDIVIRRDGAEQTVTLTPVARSAGDLTPIVGVVPEVVYDFPFQVDVQLQDVGGPSAGMMFALGIMDTLTPGELNGGANVAGTGTISAGGVVGPIGGIRQKMWGAVGAGADYFLAPTSNCDEVVGHVPRGLRVFSVTDLDDALKVLDTIRDDGDLDALPTCAAGS